MLSTYPSLPFPTSFDGALIIYSIRTATILVAVVIIVVIIIIIVMLI